MLVSVPKSAKFQIRHITNTMEAFNTVLQLSKVLFWGMFNIFIKKTCFFISFPKLEEKAPVGILYIRSIPCYVFL